MNQPHLPLVMLLGALAACVDAPDLGSTALGAGVGSGDRSNGRYQLGGTADGLTTTATGPRWSTSRVATTGETFNVIPAPVNPGNGACLRAVISGTTRQCAAPAFVGKRFVGSDGSEVEIVAVAQFEAPLSGLTLTGYQLRRISGSALTDYCPNGRLAYPMRGQVHANGAVDVDADRITWACSEFVIGAAGTATLDSGFGSGTLGKAVSWGYLPGTDYTVGTAAVPITGAQLQSLASRVARADYCYDGTPGTLEGSTLGLADYVNGNDHGVPTPAPTGLIESPQAPGVAVDGAVYPEAIWPRASERRTAGETSDQGVPLCLTKLRWSTFPIGDRCNGRLPDPRVNLPGNSAQFCEDQTFRDFAGGDAVFASSSVFNDLSLNQWVKGGDHYATTIGAIGRDALGHIEPATGYAPTPSPSAAMMGTILTAAGRQVVLANPAYAGSAPQLELRSCRKLAAPSIGERITTVAVPPGYGACEVEGYLWATPPAAPLLADLGATMRPLFLHHRASPLDYRTTTSPVPPPGYSGPVLLGYILAPRAP